MQLSNNRLGITSKEFGGFYDFIASHGQTMSWESFEDFVKTWSNSGRAPKLCEP